MTYRQDRNEELIEVKICDVNVDVALEDLSHTLRPFGAMMPTAGFPRVRYRVLYLAMLDLLL